MLITQIPLQQEPMIHFNWHFGKWCNLQLFLQQALNNSGSFAEGQILLIASN